MVIFLRVARQLDPTSIHTERPTADQTQK